MILYRKILNDLCGQRSYFSQAYFKIFVCSATGKAGKVFVEQNVTERASNGIENRQGKKRGREKKLKLFGRETVKNSTNKNQALKCEKIAKSIIK